MDEDTDEIGVITGDKCDSRGEPQLDLLVTLLPPMGDGASGAGDGLRDNEGDSSILTEHTLSIADELPRMWSMPKLRRLLGTLSGDEEDILKLSFSNCCCVLISPVDLWSRGCQEDKCE